MHGDRSNAARLKRAYYAADGETFLAASDAEIYSTIVHESMTFDLNAMQERAWREEIAIMRRAVREIGRCGVIFEYTIPRMGRRIDCVILCGGAVFAVEFKVGAEDFPRAAIDQVVDYALDLKNFHEASHALAIYPTLVCT